MIKPETYHEKRAEITEIALFDVIDLLEQILPPELFVNAKGLRSAWWDRIQDLDAEYTDSELGTKVGTTCVPKTKPEV